MGEAEIRQQVLAENLFQYRRKDTIVKALSLINKRLHVLDNTLQQMLLTQGHNDSLAILLYAFLQLYRLPREFVQEVLRYQLLQHKQEVSSGDILRFLEQKREQSHIVAAWTEQTMTKLRRVILNFLTECGMLERQAGKKQWLITPIALSDSLRAYVEREARYADFLALMLYR